jgi:hypothetical protein
MDEKTLAEKKASIEQQFNALMERRKEIDEESLKLSGEHRLVSELIDKQVKGNKKNG